MFSERPLGMNSTYLQPNAAIDAGLRDRIATPYVWDEEPDHFRNISFMQVPERKSILQSDTSILPCGHCTGQTETLANMRRSQSRLRINFHICQRLH